MLEVAMRKALLRRMLRISLVCGCISAGISLAGALSSASYDLALLSSSSGFAIGFLTPLIVQALVVGLRASSRIRGVPRAALAAASALLTMAVISVLSVMTLWLMHYIHTGGAPGQAEFRQTLPFALGLGASISLAVNLHVVLQEYLGGGFFKDLFLGKHAIPSQRLAAVAFVDLVGSTSLAERLSPQRFFAFLNDFLGTVELAAHYTGGRVYKYLGDGVIVLWELPVKDAAPLRFMTALDAELRSRRSRSIAAFGEEARHTAGLHAGLVLVGELGDRRKELGYWGDTLNTAQRIQDACKRAGAAGLVSAEALEALGAAGADSFEGYRLHRLDGVALKGKREPMTLYALRRA